MELVIKAGILRLNDKTVTPDARKGWFVITKEDELIHFYWLHRVTNNISEVDLTKAEESGILFPGDAVFSRLIDRPERIYTLKFMTSSKTLFFWMQDPSNAKDEENCNKINELINGSMEVELHEQQPVNEGESSLEEKKDRLKRRCFSDLLKKSSLIEFVHQNPDCHERLRSYLPPEINFSPAEVEKVLRSSSFSQSLSVFDSALENGHLPSLLMQFGIPFDPSLLEEFEKRSGSELFLRAMLAYFSNRNK